MNNGIVLRRRRGDWGRSSTQAGERSIAANVVATFVGRKGPPFFASPRMSHAAGVLETASEMVLTDDSLREVVSKARGVVSIVAPTGPKRTRPLCTSRGAGGLRVLPHRPLVTHGHNCRIASDY